MHNIKNITIGKYKKHIPNNIIISYNDGDHILYKHFTCIYDNNKKSVHKYFNDNNYIAVKIEHFNTFIIQNIQQFNFNNIISSYIVNDNIMDCMDGNLVNLK